MSNEPTRFWNAIAPKLRRANGLHPLSPEEAQAKLDAALGEPFSADEIETIVRSVTSSGVFSGETPMKDCVGATDPAKYRNGPSVLNNHDAGVEDEDAY